MNRVYKIVWSKAKNAYVVTSELAKNHTRSASGKAVKAALTVYVGERQCGFRSADAESA